MAEFVDENSQREQQHAHDDVKDRYQDFHVKKISLWLMIGGSFPPFSLVSRHASPAPILATVSSTAERTSPMVSQGRFGTIERQVSTVLAMSV